MQASETQSLNHSAFFSMHIVFPASDKTSDRSRFSPATSLLFIALALSLFPSMALTHKIAPMLVDKAVLSKLQ